MNDAKKPWPDWEGMEAQCPWWGWILLGAISLPFGTGFMYYVFTDVIENENRAIRMWIVFAWIYRLLGKWPIIGFFGFLSLLSIGIGICLGIRKWRMATESNGQTNG